MNRYSELTKKHEAEYNAFPIYFAFGDKQFNELLDRLGIAKEDASKKLVSIGYGGMVLEEDRSRFYEMVERQGKETEEAIKADKTGDGFIYEMFLTELYNHEYSYTGDPAEAIDACQLSLEELNASPALLHGLEKAMKYIRENEE